MARARDSAKRQAILQAAKSLFARQGFHHSSISDLKRETGLPVGTIYTYFSGKDSIMATIIEEGWQDLIQRLSLSIATTTGLEERIRILSDVFFGELLKDIESINILLTEALELTKIGEKIDRLVSLATDLIESAGHPDQPAASVPGQISDSAQTARKVAPLPSASSLRTAVIVYFLGILHAARLSRSGELGIQTADLQSFMRQIIYQNISQPLA